MTGFSRSPNLLKGALIQFSAPMLIPIPNIIIFQYNPETMTRQLVPWKPREKVVYEDLKAAEKAAPKAVAELLNELAQPFDPQETFSLTIELDATDALEEPSSHPVALIAGVADRISAMEMLCYPPGPEAFSGVLNVSVNFSIGAAGVTASVAADALPRLDSRSFFSFGDQGESSQYALQLSPSRNSSTHHCCTRFARRFHSDSPFLMKHIWLTLLGI